MRMVTFVTLFQNISFFLSEVIALFLFFVIASIVSSGCALDFAFNLRQLSEFVLSSWGSPAFHTVTSSTQTLRIWQTKPLWEFFSCIFSTETKTHRSYYVSGTQDVIISLSLPSFLQTELWQSFHLCSVPCVKCLQATLSTDLLSLATVA